MDLIPVQPDLIERKEVVRIERNLTAIGYFTPANKRNHDTVVKKVTLIVKNSDDGTRMEATATIIPTTQYGMPVTADQDKFYAFARILDGLRDKDGKLTNPVRFSSNRLLKQCGLARNGRHYQQIRDWLSRMTFTGIQSEGVIWLAGRKRRAQDRYTLFSRAISAGDELDTGEITEDNIVWLSDWLLENLNEHYVSPINYEIYKRLKNHIAKSLLPLVQNWYFASRQSAGAAFEKKYRDLAELLGIQYYDHRSRVLKSIEPSLAELVRHDVLSAWSLERTSDQREWKVVMIPGDALITKRRQALQAGQLTDPRFDRLVQEMTKRGIVEAAARKILLDVPDDQSVLDQLEWADYQIASMPPGERRNPPGFYVWIVSKNIAVPPSFETSSKREARERQRLDSQNRPLSAEELAERRREELIYQYQGYIYDQTERLIAEMPEAERTKRLRVITKNLEHKLGRWVHDNEGIVMAELMRQVREPADFMTMEEFARIHQMTLF